MKQFRKINTTDYELTRVQDAVDEAITPIITLPMLDGVFLQNILIKAMQNNAIEHKLNRKYQMWFVVRRSAQANIWETNYTNPDKLLNLSTSSDCTISLWVA